MILVDVYVPALHATYDFQIDEHSPVSAVRDEIAEILRRKAGDPPETEDGSEGFVLCCPDMQRVLDPSRTVLENGIRNGTRLMIV